MRPSTYDMYLAKMNITLDLFDNDLDGLLKRVTDVLVSDTDPVQVPSRGEMWWWKFDFVKDITLNGNRFIICYLNKFRDDEIIQYNWSSHRFKTQNVSALVVERSIFIFNPENELVFFQARKGISINQFCRVFSKLLEVRGDIKEIITNVLKHEGSFINRINELDRISSVKFLLNPSNPSNNPMFEKLDDALRNARAQRTLIRITGENLKYKDTFLEEGALSVLHGNGQAVFVGEKNGYVDKINSEEEEFLIHDQIAATEEALKEDLLTLFLRRIGLFKKGRD